MTRKSNDVFAPLLSRHETEMGVTSCAAWRPTSPPASSASANARVGAADTVTAIEASVTVLVLCLFYPRLRIEGVNSHRRGYNRHTTRTVTEASRAVIEAINQNADRDGSDLLRSVAAHEPSRLERQRECACRRCTVTDAFIVVVEYSKQSDKDLRRDEVPTYERSGSHERCSPTYERWGC